MKKYCMVNQIKPERLQDYIHAHMNPWEELLRCLKEAGTEEEYIFIYGNMAIVFIECEDIDIWLNKFGKSDVGQRWLKEMSAFIEESPFADDSGKAAESTDGLIKVFDLNQQMNGKFDPH